MTNDRELAPTEMIAQRKHIRYRPTEVIRSSEVFGSAIPAQIGKHPGKSVQIEVQPRTVPRGRVRHPIVGRDYPDGTFSDRFMTDYLHDYPFPSLDLLRSRRGAGRPSQ